VDPKLQSVAVEINDTSIRKWLNHEGRFPAVVPFQWREEMMIAGVNWAYALAWASIHTNHFSDKRWVDNLKLPDPLTGAWPEKGSQTMRLEVRFLARRFGEMMRNGSTEINQMDAIREYQLIEKLCAERVEETRPVPPPPKPTPTPQPKPTPTPPPAQETVKWPKIVLVLVPILTILVWVLPIPEPIKTIIRLVLQAIGG